MADKNTIARPYAQAVFELAREAKALDTWSEALSVARLLMADGSAAKFLLMPSLSDDERLRFLTGLISAAAGEACLLSGGDARGTNFLKLLIEYGRVSVLPEISEHFDELKAGVENTIDVTIISAAPMTAAQQKTFVQALKKRFGRDINLDTEIDENLIGGAVIRAGDVVIDGSLRSSLQGLANTLID